ncbi:MAG: helix-turn-helix domain-containing protein [Gammaproteobacteria bacterium]|nr:helix-turn-helix domain-containing protein [Gammaproteobacteria bacterium]MYE28236.1 helix-turn-helix domain-containing protein [Gammaproteobacteria bacterium]MYI01866.1 helix-turn-helix domain-containing protein [Gammaproteobacteria bacterium]
MSTIGEDLIQSLKEALAHAKGEGPVIVHEFPTLREVRERVRLTQAEMAPLMGMSLSGYRKWEQGERKVSGPATNLLRVIANEPEAVIRALQPQGH